MNGNAELLNYVYQNSEMGINTISQLLEIAKDDDFLAHLKMQHDQYQKMNQEAKKRLAMHKLDEKGISKTSQVKTQLMIHMQTITDQSTSHLAEMMLIGSNMGVIDALKNIRQYGDADREVLQLMEGLLHFEEESAEKLKAFI
ncbi:MAG: hypothetical protein RR547_09655 [Raoultibacter sp.]